MRPKLAACLVLTLALAFPTVAAAQPQPAPLVKPDAAAPAAPAAPAAAAPAGSSSVLLLSLRVMHEKGMITDAEYQSAVRDLADSLGTRVGESTNLVIGKWSTTLYGFAEADYIYDSTQSLIDVPGNAQIARAGTYGGDHGRMQFGARNSRWGMRLRAPEAHDIRASAVIEADFFQPPANGGGLAVNGTTTSNAFGSEQNFWTNPVFRMRHAYIKLETPVVDFLFGQYWQLFGWQPLYMPATTSIQGVPGELFARTPQLRVSKTIGADGPISFEIAAAAARPPQRDSGTPEGEGGLRISFNRIKAMYTSGQTGTSLAPMSLAVSGDVRRIAVNEFSASPVTSNEKIGTSFAANALIPILPASKEKKGNTLTALAQFAYGYGISDIFTGLTGGVGFPALANPTGANPPPTYKPNIDPGIATYDANGNLHYIQWQTYLLGLQYYLPRLDGRMWISANYSHLSSPNMTHYFTGKATAGVRSAQDWFSVTVMGDVTDAVRLGIEYSNTNDDYLDGTHAINHRGQMSAFYIF